ncbi:hypothetical protein [Shewanella algae]|uniref:hypothetical protein n=1 Tax=Shewanella algae TaxID=38313 RepID=UPI00399A53CF
MGSIYDWAEDRGLIPSNSDIPLEAAKDKASAIVPPCTPKAAIKSDGGDSSYYDFVIHSSYGGSLKVKTGDVIRAMVYNDFDLGNILKACRRIAEAQRGRGKLGTDAEYDCNKIAYFAKELQKFLNSQPTNPTGEPLQC